jgi:hypothetical protein
MSVRLAFKGGSRIQPHITVAPTIKGIRDGRDEVLEAAVKYLQTPR